MEVVSTLLCVMINIIAIATSIGVERDALFKTIVQRCLLRLRTKITKTTSNATPTIPIDASGLTVMNCLHAHANPDTQATDVKLRRLATTRTTLTTKVLRKHSKPPSQMAQQL
jgi:hypothetical protein